MLVPLHVKSHYSLGYGTAPPAALAARAASSGIPALALTDLENLYGQIEFHHACHERGIRPITGVELRPGFGGRAHPGEKRGRLVLLAADRAGYGNLCRIVTRRRTAPAGDPLDSLGEDTGSLLALSDDADTLDALCRSGAIPRERLRATVVRRGADSGSSEVRLIAAAQRLGIQLLADPDVVLLEREDHALHVLQVAVARKRTVSEVRASQTAESPLRSFAAPAELVRLYNDVPGAVAATRSLAEAIELDLRRADPVLPAVELRANESASARLAAVCKSRLDRGRAEARWPGREYDERLQDELGTIRAMQLDNYFLVVGEIVARAGEMGILVAGRGSAGGSLVAHLLGVTSVDPVAHGLLFERLLHQRRQDVPDVDVDVSSDRRDELIEWVFRRFGERNVAMVSAHARFRRRSAYREGLKALGMPLREVEAFARKLPPEELLDLAEAHGGEASDGGAEPALSFPVLPQPYRDSGALLERLIGMPQYFAVHPGGVVIADRPIEAYLPLERAAKGVVASQYDMRSLQHTGLVKIDLLGNHCLTELQDTIALVGEEDLSASEANDVARRRRKRLRDEGVRGIPEDDRETLQTIDRADTIGCFQLESPAMRSLLAQVPIHGLDDVIAALALVRPGAASGDAKQAFIRRSHGEEPVDFLHPLLQARLEGTHGVLLYEEDVILVLSILGGMSIAEADEVRAAVADAQHDAAALARLEAGFLRGAAEGGVPADLARRAWELVLKFAAYSFSKAHASSYGLMGYQAAFLRTHFPVEFGCAVLNHHGGIYPLRTLASAIGRWGVSLLPPSVDHSAIACTLERRGPGAGAVRVGLGKVKRLSERSVLGILRAREEGGAFRDLSDLLRRVGPATREVQALILSGACDHLAPLSAAAYPFVHEAVLEALEHNGDPAQLGILVSEAPAPAAGNSRETYRSLVRIRNELKFLEMHVSAHPMAVLRGEARRHGCVTTGEARRSDGRTVWLAGIVAATRRVPTKGASVMQFVTIEDEEGTLEAVIFPPAYRAWGSVITTPGPFLLAGRVQADHGDVHLVVTGLHPFHQRDRVTRPVEAVH